MTGTIYCDLRFSLRMLRKQPRFALVAASCLAIGIGANAAIFSLLNSLLLRSLPVNQANRLVVLHRGKNFGFSFPDYQDLASRFRHSGAMLAAFPTESSLDRAGYQGELVTAEAVTGNYAHVLQARTELGDWFDNEDSPVAVISYGAWQQFFHGDPRALGQRVRSETQWYTVVAIAPKDFTGLVLPRTTSIWVPLRIWMRQHPAMEARFNNRDNPLLTVFARLSASVKDSDATAQLRLIETQLNRETVHRVTSRDSISVDHVRGVIATGDRATVERVGDLLFAVVGVLLLICCVNVGNLLLVRGASRESEVAIRYSLGATRARIMRQLLMDSFLLAILGGAGGLLVDVPLTRFILHLLPVLPLQQEISLNVPMDWRVILFVATSALATIVLFGWLPAWKATSYSLSTRIRGSQNRLERRRLRKSSAVAQVALSFVLLVLAAMFLATCWHLQQASPGFAVRNRLYATTYISRPEFKPEQIPDFYQRVLADLRSMPNIRSAGLTYLLPLGFSATECVKSLDSTEIQATASTISPGFLRTMNIAVVQGRDFDVSDAPNRQRVVLINQKLAQKFWPNSSAVGHEVQLGCSERSTATVVGITANSKTVSLTEPFRPHVYQAFAQSATGLANIVIETSIGPESMIEQFRRTLLNEGHGMRVYAVNELSHHVEQSYWQLRWEAWLLGAFGVAALLLAALGLYGVVSYSTALRQKEFGIRIAVGAQGRDILQLVVNEGLAIAALGVCLGSLATFGLTGFLRNYLLEGRRSVALTCCGVGVLWLLIVTGACYGPARRSSRVEPSTALHYE